jgi:hypothetical protein
MARSRRTSAMLVDRCSCGLSGRELQRKTKSHRLRAERLPSLSGDTVLNGAVSRVLTKNIPITLTLMGLRPGLSSVSPVQVRFEKRLRSINQFPWEATLSFVIPSAPGFPLRTSHRCHLCGSPQREPHAVVRSCNPRQEIRGSRGICSSADLSWKRATPCSNRIVISPAPACRGTEAYPDFLPRSTGQDNGPLDAASLHG